MNILHYFLGFPPYRTGGLTRYCYDLMQAQVQNGDQVSALWPGMLLSPGKPSFRKRKSILGIHNYELINPLPVSLDEGIQDVDRFTKACDPSVFKRLLSEIQADVIHIHTLMGLYQEFLLAAKELNIRTVFTTHDYFGICPKVTLYDCGRVCGDDGSCVNCVACNQGALSMNKIRIMQSPVYRALKDSAIVKHLRKKHRSDFFEESDGGACVEIPVDDSQARKYMRLRTYYTQMLEKIDCIHFNSSVAENVYRRYIMPKSSVMMTITHKNIKDARSESGWLPSEQLRLTLLAPPKPYKGFQVLREALDRIWESNAGSFLLNVYAPVKQPAPYMQIQEGGFQQSELKEIFDKTDVLLAPSVWYETFGFTVLEALSFGVPVIVSDHVGAKDVIGSGGFVVHAGDAEELQNIIRSLSTQQLIALRKNIQTGQRVKLWDEFVNEVQRLYCGY